MNHWVHMTSTVRHLFLAFGVRQVFRSYELSEHSGCAIDNTRSAWRSVDTADFGLVATAAAPRPTHMPHPEPARRLN